MRKVLKKFRKVFFLAILLGAVFFALTIIAHGNKKTIIYALEGRSYHLLVAKTPEEWEKGLMSIRQKRDFDGMLFVFPEKEVKTFWNKETYLDLDLYWISGEDVIGKSYLPSIEKTKNITQVMSPGKVDKVIEIIR